MDYGYKFELLVNSYLGKPDYVTYATYWDDDNDRRALLFTICLKEYDNNVSGTIGEKLSYFMEELFNEESEKFNVSIECLKFLSDLNKLID